MPLDTELSLQLTIYQLEDSKAFDLALLAALIRGNAEGSSSLASMRLAITWNRPSLAVSLILPNSKFSVSHVTHVMIICEVKILLRRSFVRAEDMRQDTVESTFFSS